jgi:hypothetical protein
VLEQWQRSQHRMRTVRRRIYAAHLTGYRGIIEQLEKVEIDAIALVTRLMTRPWRISSHLRLSARGVVSLSRPGSSSSPDMPQVVLRTILLVRELFKREI